MKFEIKEELVLMEATGNINTPQIDINDMEPLLKCSPESLKQEENDSVWQNRQGNQAEIPDFIEHCECDEDEDEAMDTLEFSLAQSDKKLPDKDVSRLQKELSHLPFDAVLKILLLYNMDIKSSIRLGRDYILPDLVPQWVKDHFVANMAIERAMLPIKKPKEQSPHFYMADQFENVVSSASLVDFYYKEKNAIEESWSFGQEPELSQTEKEALELKMAKCKISIVECKPRSTKRRGRKNKRRSVKKEYPKSLNSDPFSSPNTKSKRLSEPEQ
uniref:Uncharacterized protein n=1 Tax=Caenorhabditis japonica TaxID=281687 RepID=A0A8R1DR33_CAEJA